MNVPVSAAVGWGLAAVAVVVGYLSYGWPGLALALTVVVFWLLLQFSRALRVLRDAASRPVGHVDNAVMLHAKLHTGMRLPQVLKLTRSLGKPLAEEPNETFGWSDATGDAVELVFRNGQLTHWQLQRAPAAAVPAEGTASLPG